MQFGLEMALLRLCGSWEVYVIEFIFRGKHKNTGSCVEPRLDFGADKQCTAVRFSELKDTRNKNTLYLTRKRKIYTYSSTGIIDRNAFKELTPELWDGMEI